jgi:inorganic pyrophosphatase
MHSAQDYPFDYGFVPQTLWDDGDALDVVLLTTYPLAPGILVEARPIGVLHMTDSGEADEKIIAVLVSDPRFSTVSDLKDANQHVLKEISHFFGTYKQIQKKEVVVGDFEGRSVAQEAFDRSREMYVQKQS